MKTGEEPQKPQSWPDCDEAVQKYVSGLVDLLKCELKDNLTGVYLHGSLATGSWFWPKSDLDVLAVVYKRLDPERARETNLSIARYAENRPLTGGVELSVITAETAGNVPDAMPFELHYSEDWRQRILDDQVVYGNAPVDIDLQAHLMCVKKRGVCLFGKRIGEVFGDVSWRNFLAAVLDDFSWIMADENICESPYYGILNICRVLQTVTEKDQRILSKYEGGMWGLEDLPDEYIPLIQKALDIYSSRTAVAESERRTGGVHWDKRRLLALRDYAKRIVYEN